MQQQPMEIKWKTLETMISCSCWVLQDNKTLSSSSMSFLLLFFQCSSLFFCFLFSWFWHVHLCTLWIGTWVMMEGISGITSSLGMCACDNFVFGPGFVGSPALFRFYSCCTWLVLVRTKPIAWVWSRVHACCQRFRPSCPDFKFIIDCWCDTSLASFGFGYPLFWHNNEFVNIWLDLWLIFIPNYHMWLVIMPSCLEQVA